VDLAGTVRQSRAQKHSKDGYFISSVRKGRLTRWRLIFVFLGLVLHLWWFATLNSYANIDLWQLPQVTMANASFYDCHF
jgi:hypothetical protein